MEGNRGNDVITTGDRGDEISAGAGNDVVDAGAGDNRVDGQGGDDTLVAGGGNDRMNGQQGFDACAPGAGSNTVINCEAITESQHIEVGTGGQVRAGGPVRFGALRYEQQRNEYRTVWNL